MTSSRLNKVMRVLSFILLGVFLLACTSTNPSTPDPTPGPDPSPTPTPTPEPEPTEQLTVRHYTSDEGGVTVEMDEKTIYVQPDLSKTIKEFDEENGIFVFENSETLDNLEIKVGDYLYSTERTEQFPDGYCFEVVSVKTTKSPTKGDDITGPTGSYGPGSNVTEVGVTQGFLTDAIKEFNGRVGIDWQSLSENDVTGYEIEGSPDLQHISDQILDKTLFKKRKLGDDFSVKFGARKTTVEYTIWKNNPSVPVINQKQAEMKLSVAVTLEHELDDPLVYIHNGDFYLDTDLGLGATFTLQFKVEGKSLKWKDLTGEEKEAFLKFFESNSKEAFNRQVRLLHWSLPISPTNVIVNPSLDLLWDFRIDKIGGEFKLTVGYTGAKYNFHYERLDKNADKLDKGKLITQKDEAQWVLNAEGDLEGVISTGPMVCFSIECPALPYTGEMKNVQPWRNYKGLAIPSFVGGYFEAVIQGSFKLLAKYDAIKNSLLRKILLSMKFRLNVGVEYLLGFSKILVGYDRKEINLKEYDWGSYEYVLDESNVGEYCISPEIGSYIPEGEPVVLEWGTTRDYGSKLTYDVFFGSSEDNLQLIKANTSDTKFVYNGSEPLKPGNYYWRVYAKQPDGQEFASDKWFFAIGNDPTVTEELRAIELGLPSGITWGDRNIDAFFNSDHGQYYQWGSTSPVTGQAFWDNYKWSNEDGTKLNKYNFDDYLMVLDSKDDAAAANLDRTGWRMPTKEEWEELKKNCSWTLTERNGISGYIVKNDATGAYIFIPIQTSYLGKDGKMTAQGGMYWTASRSMSQNPYLANAAKVSSPDKVTIVDRPRYEGLMVRPVFAGNMVPGMELNTNELKFGNVAKGDSKTITLSVKNVGYSPLYLTLANISNPFSCSQYLEDIAVDPGANAVFNIVFKPEEIKEYESFLIISSNAARGAEKVVLKGNGVAPGDGGIDDVPGHNL